MKEMVEKKEGYYLYLWCISSTISWVLQSIKLQDLAKWKHQACFICWCRRLDASSWSFEVVVGLELDQKVVRGCLKDFGTQPHFHGSVWNGEADSTQNRSPGILMVVEVENLDGDIKAESLQKKDGGES